MTTNDNKLKLIAQKAKQDPKSKFPLLMELIDQEGLVKSYKKLNKDSASGADGITVRQYGTNLEDKIKELYSKITKKTYKPQPVKRVYIPKKGKDAFRPLGLPSVEDKVVQMKLKEILEAIYEQDFLYCSYGFRPDKSCHMVIKELHDAVMHEPVNYIVEVDVKQFFGHVNHKWLYEMLKLRISDPRFLGLIWKILKAGELENSKITISEEGTPQGGIISPILANVYLHYVLDLWFEKSFKPRARGYVQLIRYCDDFVVVCESEHDANDFLTQLKNRFAKFNLEVSPEKTQILKFGRAAWKRSKQTGEKVKTFDFLGFTHYCTKSRKGWFIMAHKTAKDGLASKLKDFNGWLIDNRNMLPLDVLWKHARIKLMGHFNYFGINGNMRSLQ
ncbi:MAG: reverse transcriptase [candidate division TM6 bacterium GW2011_GWF2_30_66]|nr:MAG: reverse transcriptase [candidate division TM6 bacterium GW2011_GWF2_30_66]